MQIVDDEGREGTERGRRRAREIAATFMVATKLDLYRHLSANCLLSFKPANFAHLSTDFSPAPSWGRLASKICFNHIYKSKFNALATQLVGRFSMPVTQATAV